MLSCQLILLTCQLSMQVNLSVNYADLFTRYRQVINNLFNNLSVNHVDLSVIYFHLSEHSVVN